MKIDKDYIYQNQKQRVIGGNFHAGKTAGQYSTPKDNDSILCGGQWKDAMDRDLERDPPRFEINYHYIHHTMRNIAFDIFDDQEKTK
jgi:hypothetical protein